MRAFHLLRIISQSFARELLRFYPFLIAHGVSVFVVEKRRHPSSALLGRPIREDPAEISLDLLEGAIFLGDV